MKSIVQASVKLGRAALAVVAAVAVAGVITLSAGAASAESGCHKNPPPKADGPGLLARAD
ncbi:MAG: hypothetical protein AAFY08_13960 [Planctomycetota bacterium]